MGGCWTGRGNGWLRTGLAWGASWALVSAALAADVAVVGLHDATRSGAAQDEAMAAVIAAIELAGHDAVESTAFSRQLAGREPLILVGAYEQDGQRLLEEGRAYYQQAQLALAVEVLEDAVRRLDEAARITGQVRSLWEAYMLLGTARRADGDDFGASEALQGAAALQPNRRPDPAIYPPNVIDLYDEERRIARGEAGSLTVGFPEGAEGVEEALVHVDGVEVGQGFAAVDDLLPGIHYATVRTWDGRLATLRFDLEAEETRIWEPELGPADLGAAVSSVRGRSQQIAALYRAVGRYADVDGILVLGRIDDVLHAQLYLPAADGFSPAAVGTTVGDLPELSGLVGEVLEPLRRDGTLPQDLVRSAPEAFDISTNPVLARLLRAPAKPTRDTLPGAIPGEGPIDGPSTKNRTPLYVGLGVGGAVLVGAAVALGVILGQPEEAPPGTGTLTIQPR